MLEKDQKMDIPSGSAFSTIYISYNIIYNKNIVYSNDILRNNTRDKEE